MKKRNCLLAAGFCVLSFLNFEANAQTNNEDAPSMEVYSIAVTIDTLEVKNPNDSTLFSVFIHLSVNDTASIEKIIVCLGDAGFPGNRLEHVFDWDVYGSTGNRTNYSRIGKNVILSLGNYTGLLHYEAIACLKLLDGTYIELVRYSQ